MGVRDVVKEQLFKRIYSGELGKLSDAYDLLIEAYRKGPAVLSQETLLANIGELDSQLLDLIIRQRGYDPLIGSGMVGSYYEFTESDRLRAVMDSRGMYHSDVQNKRAVKSWTDFGFGQTISVLPADPAAEKVWDEFINAQRNAPILKQRKLQKLSNTILVDGEIFFVFYISAVDGSTTIRRFKTEEIKQIIYADDDNDIPLYYVRDEDGGQVYYRDWNAPQDEIDNYQIPDGVRLASEKGGVAEFVNGDDTPDEKPVTDVMILHAAFEEENGRGWPVFNTSFPWSRSYQGFLRDRATVAKAVAAMVDEIIHKGGSRVQSQLIDQIASTLTSTMPFDSNSPPVAGSTGVHNDALEIRRRPLTTGAGDAQMDGITLLGQVSAGDYLPSHWRGRPDAMQNRATAREVERPWLEAMQRYQTFWADIFTDILRIVLNATGKEYADYTAEVYMQSPFVMYPDEAADAITSISGAAEKGTLSYEIATVSIEIIVALVLTTYGINNVRELFNSVKQQPQERTIDSEAILKVSKLAVDGFREGEHPAGQVIDYLYSVVQELIG